jgi:hypothetical protein
VPGVAFLLVILVSWQPAGAQESARPAGEVKAGYLFAFGRFVQWPAHEDDGAFAVCVLGRDPFGPVLERTFASQTLRGRPVVARRLTTAAEATGCEVLYVSESEEPLLPAVLDAVRHRPVLTVSDIRGFVGRGGMIEFTPDGGRIRFIVDLAPALDSGLTLSSELLRVAKSVRGSQGRR